MAESSSSILRRRLLFATLIAVALLIGLWQPLDPGRVYEWGDQLAGNPLAVLAIIVSQALLLALALPGSMLLWAVAPFHPPILAVPILLAGSVSGAVGGYFLSRHLGSGWRPRGGQWLINLLAERGDFLTQCALRVLPGCPHWAANYGAGMLRLPLPTFILAAMLGLSVKWAVYCWAIHGATAAARAGESFDLSTLVPLAVLGAALVLGGMARRRLASGSERNRVN